MSKGKKICLTVSLIISAVFLSLVLAVAHTQRVYATTTDGIYTDLTDDDGLISSTDDDENAAGNGVSITYNNGDGTLSGALRILIVLTVISLAPSILIMLTSFTRIIIVLHFVRQAIGTQTAPPNQVLVGLALFLTLFIMSPVFTEINEVALKPLDAGEITEQEALDAGLVPLREFMYGQTQTKDLNLFLEI